MRKKSKLRVIFMGTPDFAVPSLRRLIDDPDGSVIAVVTQPDRRVGRKQTKTAPPVKVVAQQFQIPVLQPERLSDSPEAKQIIEEQPDLIVTAAYGQMLPESILQLPQWGCVNIHASLLPKYRGGAPIHRALINGEKETGITIMTMVKAMDAGDMLMQRSIPIRNVDTVGSLHNQLADLGAKMLTQMLPEWVAGRIEPIPQDHAQATYAPNLSTEDETIDWSRPAKQIDYQVRGLHPWPVASTTFQKKRWKIWRVQPTEQKTTQAPGTIIQIHKQSMEVATGDGTILLKEIQPAGKKRMTVADFLCGTSMTVGDGLGT